MTLSVHTKSSLLLTCFVCWFEISLPYLPSTHGLMKSNWSTERRFRLACCRCPDVCKVREKMIYASSKDELKKRLVGVATEVQGSDKSDVDINVVVERVNRV
jgi:hypothetical protein